jgi:phosphoglycerol transferase MdoB-like AlkP superfamily enzyme
LLPALRENIAQSKDLAAGLICLPQIFKQYGFKTLYFQSYPDFTFANRDVFMKLLGFDALHSEDIMKPEDKLLPWGYAEDVFLSRVLEYLTRYAGQKLFVYITLSATNHYPFSSEGVRQLHPQVLDMLPYRKPKTFEESIADTTFLQDQVFGGMYKRYKETYAPNSNMFVFGDHSWPIGIHPGNIANANLAFEENFVSTLAFFPATKNRDRFRIGKRVQRIYSHLDLLPTVLDMYGIGGLNYYGKSFLHELSTDVATPATRCLVSVQPFNGGFIAAVNFPLKRIYDLHNNEVTTYDLQQDPNELSPLSRDPINSRELKVLDGCLNSLAR